MPLGDWYGLQRFYDKNPVLGQHDSQMADAPFLFHVFPNRPVYYFLILVCQHVYGDRHKFPRF